MQFYHKNPCKCVVLALFSELLSALHNYNILIYNMLKSQADSDRCFSTFIFFVICRKRLHDDVLHISKKTLEANLAVLFPFVRQKHPVFFPAVY